MRKIITTTFVTLDGVMQAPGGPTEDTEGGFKYGGWQYNFKQDEELGAKIMSFMQMPFSLLLGKVTYNIFAGFWPHATTDLEVAKPFNECKKYVVSHTHFDPEWNNTTCISGNILEELKKLKEEDGPDLWVYGSGNLIQTLLENNLIDRMHLFIYPITLGTGKKLFEGGTKPLTWNLVDSLVGKTGAIFATYEPVGPQPIYEE